MMRTSCKMIDQSVDNCFKTLSTQDLDQDSPSPQLNKYATMKRRLLKSNIRLNFRSFTTSEHEDLEKPKYVAKNRFFGKYHIGPKLGEGSQAVVKLCTEDENPIKKLVVKIMDISDIELLFMRIQEHLMMQELRHPNIIKVMDFFVCKQEKKAYQVQERASGKTLKSMLIKRKRFTELSAFKIFKQLIKGIQYLHMNGVCHRDLTLDNLIYSDEENLLKIIDFGISRKNFQTKMWTKTGKTMYMAPEMFNNEYDESVDVWAVGIVLFALTIGYLPFQSEGDAELEVIENIRTQELDFEEYLISTDLKSLLDQLLQKDSKKRIKLYQVTQHPWYKKKEKEILSDIEGLDIEQHHKMTLHSFCQRKSDNAHLDQMKMVNSMVEIAGMHTPSEKHRKSSEV